MDWQPIVTAPKDGSRVLIVEGRYISVAERTGDSWRYMARDDWACHMEQGDAWPPYANPTHWMPLPEPPAALIVDPASHDRGAK